MSAFEAQLFVFGSANPNTKKKKGGLAVPNYSFGAI